MKLIVIVLISVSLYAAEPSASEPAPQVDADKLAIVEAQRDRAYLAIRIKQAEQEADDRIIKAIAARAARLKCEINPQTADCKPEPKPPAK